jgi:hypothetical protein
MRKNEYMKVALLHIGSMIEALHERGLQFLRLFLVVWACLGAGDVYAGLKIYYIRHAEGGHNVKKAWEAKGVPKSEWPSGRNGLWRN